MFHSILTSNMQESDIAEAVEIWVEQYKRYCSGYKSFPCSWIKNTSGLTGFLYKKVIDNTAIVVRSNNRLLGLIVHI